MVSILASSVIDRGFEPRSGQTKDYQIVICCFSPKHAVLRRKSKDWLARYQNNVSEWSDMSIQGRLFQPAIIIILSNVTCSRHDIVGVKQQSLTQSNSMNICSTWCRK
jgi:hypothetical protein